MSKVTMTCARCGKTYQLSPSAAKPTRLYCSNECRRTRVTRACEVCGTDFAAKPSDVQRGNAKYCSAACRARAATTGEIRACETCGQPFRTIPSRIKAGGTRARYCSRACTPQQQPVPVQQRFWDKVNRRADDDCWEWQAHRNEDGYGQVRYEGRMVHAHRVSFLLSGRELIEGLEVMHTCDNPACVNPAHLTLGTHQDNMQDRVNKGRHLLSGYRGEAHQSAKLTEEQVQEARRLYRSGAATPKELSTRLGIGTSATHAMLKGKSWKHVP